MRAGWTAGLACGMAVLATAAFSEPWQGSQPSRRPEVRGLPDLDFAISELCFPYLVDQSPVASIVARPLVERVPNLSKSASHRGTFAVGRPDIVVEFWEHEARFDRIASRDCSVTVKSGDREMLHALLESRLKQLARFSPAARQPPPSRSAKMQDFCSPPDGPQFFVNIGVGRPRTGVPNLMVTISRDARRSRFCDAPAPGSLVYEP